ncbi:MAG: selenide, water dikinase SelD [Kiritimatiellaeota bacterium]|nr:selenide, water dikinase SelD [Kiritimatiellota bacterium]
MKKPDLAKRKKVMGRSIRLGHCVCDPSKPCPCPMFQHHNVCLCAGEHLPVKGPVDVKLTRHVRSAGCASKIGQEDLHAVLSKLPKVTDKRLVIGLATADDAGVFEIRPGTLLVQTVDVFTPGVDDPYTFGRIAACNALSDVYAMGGGPVTALSIIGFPIHTLPHSAMTAILRGGMDVLGEAGAVLVGGHSINDDEVKFGLAVTGLVTRSALTTNAAAKPGDVLILTKPLGTGIIALAGQLGRASARAQKAAAESMATLNRRAAELMVRHRVKAATDVTGFGLLGHLTRMMLESKATAEIAFDALPLLPDTLDYATAGMYSGANERNASFSEKHTRFASNMTEAEQAVLYDAQTSGGLLMSVPPLRAGALLKALHAEGIPHAAIIGRVTLPSSRAVKVERSAENVFGNISAC